MSLRSGGRQLSFELLAGDLTADDPDDISPRSLPDTSSDGQRRRRRRSKRKRGFRSPPIQEAVSEGEQQPRVEGGGNSAAAFRVLDLKSTAETVCESSDAERSAASCVTYVGVELRQRSVSGGGRVVEASANDGTSSYGDGVPLSMDATAVLDAFSAAPRHQLRPAAWCRSTRFASQACRATAPFARADWQAACAIHASNSTGGGGHDASSNTQPTPRVNSGTPCLRLRRSRLLCPRPR